MIKLRKMTAGEFPEFLKTAIPRYCVEKMKSDGTPIEDSEKSVHDAFHDLLSEGVQTPDQFLFSIIEKSSGDLIGCMWFGRKKRASHHFAFIYEFFLEPHVRGKGYGKAALALVEDEIRKEGLSSVGLHVFAHNETAIGLYEKVGFKTTNRIMMKQL